MNFLALPLQPAAGAAGVASRVRLPAVGPAALNFSVLPNGPARPAAVPARPRPHASLAQHRAQDRAQCRSFCLNKG